MARQFTKDLQGPDTRGLSPTNTGDTRSAGVGTAIQGVSNALSALSGLAEDRKVEERNRFLADAEISITELEDERNALLEQERTITNTQQDIYSDNIVTDEERSVLASLEKDVNKLKQARATGILSETGYTTRLNSLKKKALNDSVALGVSTQVTALFNQGRRTIEQPIDPVTAQLHKTMDEKYGVGNWSVADLGKERGALLFNQRAIEAAQVDINTASSNIPQVMSNTFNTALTKLQQSLVSNGAITDESKDLYTVSINTQWQQSIAQIDALAANIQSDPTKKLSKDHFETIKQLKEQATAQRDMFLKMVSSEGTFGDRDVVSRIKDAAIIQENLMKLQNPQLASSGNSIMGSGGKSHVDMFKFIMDDNNANMLLRAIPEETRPFFSVDTMRTNMAQAIQASMEGGPTLQELANRGLINKAFAMMLGNKGINGAGTEEEVRNVFSVFQDVDVTDLNTTMNALSNPSKVRSIKALEGSAKTAAKQELSNLLGNYSESIRGEIEEFTNPQVEKLRDGTYQVTGVSGGTLGSVPIPKQQQSKLVTNYLNMVKLYEPVTGFTVEQALDRLIPQNEEKGDRETPQANNNNNSEVSAEEDAEINAAFEEAKANKVTGRKPSQATIESARRALAEGLDPAEVEQVLKSKLGEDVDMSEIFG